MELLLFFRAVEGGNREAFNIMEIGDILDKENRNFCCQVDDVIYNAFSSFDNDMSARVLTIIGVESKIPSSGVIMTLLYVILPDIVRQ